MLPDQERGGAVYVEHGHLYIGSTSFEGNKADVSELLGN